MATLQHGGAAAPGPVTPRSDNARVQPGAIESNRNADKSDCAARAAAAEADKAFATLRAELAMRGFELHIVSDGAGGSMFMIQRWCQSRTLATLADVRAFANGVGANPC
jgi:hypothetical protein